MYFLCDYDRYRFSTAVKHATDVNGFVLGGRSVGPWLTAFAYGTSYFSAVIFIGYAGQFGWKYGIASTWIGVGNALIGSLLAWVILGKTDENYDAASGFGHHAGIFRSAVWQQDPSKSELPQLPLSF